MTTARNVRLDIDVPAIISTSARTKKIMLKYVKMLERMIFDVDFDVVSTVAFT